MPKPDFFSVDVMCPHLVAVTETVLIETPDRNVSKEVLRGIYFFKSFKEARHFTTVVNNCVDGSLYPVAFQFKRQIENGEDGNE